MEGMVVEDKSVLSNETEAWTDVTPKVEDPIILEEISIEELSVDGICGVY
jgi:mycofactocin precursor